MIDEKLLDALSVITDEEQAILDGSSEINRSIYMEGTSPVISADKLMEDGRLISIRPQTRFVHFPEHTHDYVELVYMCRGRSVHVVNGREITLREGDLLFMGSHAVHENLPSGRDDVAVNFIVRPEFFASSLAMLGEESTPLREFVLSCLTRESGGFLLFRTAGVLPIENIIENLIWTIKNNTPNKRNINQSTMGLLFVLLLNHTDTLACESDEREAVFSVMRYIEGNYRSGSLEEIAAQLYRDYFWLSREIKRKTGKTYTQLVQDKRLSQAAFLLRNTPMNVSDIAREVGYENVSFFHRLFRARFSVSPKDYRDRKL